MPTQDLFHFPKKENNKENNKENQQGFALGAEASKRPTSRQAIASGQLLVPPETMAKLKAGNLPQGEIIPMAEVAGVMGAKKTADIFPLCRPCALDHAQVQCTLDGETSAITVFAQVAYTGKNSVAMEALMATNTALLALWQLLHTRDEELRISNVQLLVETGRADGLWVNTAHAPEWLLAQLPAKDALAGYAAGVLVMSDRASQGVYADASGARLADYLTQKGADVTFHTVIPDEATDIETTLRHMAQQNTPPRLLLTSGGTGPGNRDVTPQVLEKLCDTMFHGLGELLRHESGFYTETPWLSRMTAGMLGTTLVIALPGSPKAVQECLDIIDPFLPQTLACIAKQNDKTTAEGHHG